MTSDAIQILKLIFGVIWSIFSSFEIPGTHTTPAEFGFFMLGTVLAIKIARRIIFLDGGDEMPPLQNTDSRLMKR